MPYGVRVSMIGSGAVLPCGSQMLVFSRTPSRIGIITKWQLKSGACGAIPRTVINAAWIRFTVSPGDLLVAAECAGRSPYFSTCDPATLFLRTNGRVTQSVQDASAPPELPALLVRADAVAHRHMDANHGRGMAGARAVEQRLHRRLGRRRAVAADPRALAAGGRVRRSARQAPHRPRRANVAVG